jgi:hydroxyethylthiazole kinase-like uncharacterized protein yjeF
MQGLKVITAAEMSRIEQLAYASGASDEVFMENAGKTIAFLVDDYLSEAESLKEVTLVVGKGNNGGDAFVAGVYLLQRKYRVHACHPFPVQECSSLCQKQRERFIQAGGTISETVEFPGDGIILDGLVGTGFEGKAEGVLAEAIEAINHAFLPIIAIDIPSGLNGNTGEVGSVAVNAEMTIALGLPKLGFYIGCGWNHVGDVIVADFGLEQKWLDEAAASCYLIDDEMMPFALPPMQRSRHKYQAGYVLGVAGSEMMPGAAHLSSLAALRCGAGIVRLFHRETVSGLPPEIIAEQLGDAERFFEEVKRASSLFIGPGLGRTKEVEKLVKYILPRLTLPAVLDADCLYYLAQNPSLALPEKTVLTPHHQEMIRLLHGVPFQQESDLYRYAKTYVDEKNVTLVLKGAPTWIFHPGKAPLVVPRGDPGMATAGSGDVLTGMIAALLAQGLSPYSAAVLGVYLHALAGEGAAFNRTSYSVIASDLIEHLSDAFNFLTAEQ